MTAPMCENCKDFREFDEFDHVDEFMRRAFDGYCFSENKEHGKGKPHTKADWCEDFGEKCDWSKCINTPRWEIGFTVIIHDTFMFEGSGKNEYQQNFCDKHFIGLDGCGNVVCFRKIGEEKWLDFTDYDNSNILKELVKKSYKIYTTVQFKKLNNFY